MSLNPHLAEARRRLMAFVTVDADGCWLFGGSTSGHGRGGGYGRLRYRGQYWAAHRLAYCAFVGPLKPGYQVDHCCPGKNPPARACINPDHLDQVTHLRNQRRRVARARERVVAQAVSP